MPRPICVSCQREMKCIRNDVTLEILRHAGTLQKPYQLWLADLFSCSNCGASITSGYGDQPIWREGESTAVYDALTAQGTICVPEVII